MSAHLHVLGRLGRDTELLYLQDGTAVCNLAIAYNYGRKDADGNQPTQWLEASLFGKRAEALQPYLNKGTQLTVLIESPHVESYDKKDGGQGVKLTGRVLDVGLCGGGSGNAGGEKRQPASKPEPAASRERDVYDEAFDDGIPF